MGMDQGQQEEYNQIISQLGAEDSDTRRWAVYDLEKFPVEVTTDHLVKRLEDEHRAVREAAAEVLESVPVDLCMSQLTPQLGNPRIEVRNLAAALIAKFGEGAVPYLLDALKEGNEDVRKFSADILGLAGSDKAIEGLAEALYDPVENVGVSVAEALGKIKSPDALPHLLAAFDKCDYLKRECAESLGLLGVPDGAIFLMGKLAETNDLLVRYAMIDALGNAGDNRVLEFLEKSFDSLPAELHIAVALSLLKIANRENIRLLSRPTAPVDAIINGSLEDNEDYQQLLIGQINAQVTEEVLTAFIHKSDALNAHVLVEVMKAARNYSNLTDFCLDMTAHDDDWVAYTAIEHLPDIDKGRLSQVLKGILDGERTLPQMAAMKMVVRLDLPNRREWLEPFLEAQDDDVRSLAQQLLDQ